MNQSSNKNKKSYKMTVVLSVLALAMALFGIESEAAASSVSSGSTFSLKSDFKGFINTGSKELYVEYFAPQEGQATVILLNGLTYSTSQWFTTIWQLRKRGLGVVTYDMDGQGKTLLRYGVKFSPYHYTDQVIDLNNLLKVMKLKAPYNIVGLSYGGGIGAAFAFKYPKKIRHLILLAPFTKALEQQDLMIKAQIAATRVTFPYNPASDDELYDYFLKQIVYTTYPAAEPIVLENPWKLEAVFRMTQGIRKFDVTEEIYKFPAQSVTLVIAQNDQYIPRKVLEDFWNEIPEESRFAKYYIKNSEHKIPEAAPKAAADVIEEVVSQ